jgi:hypothetical protein
VLQQTIGIGKWEEKQIYFLLKQAWMEAVVYTL